MANVWFVQNGITPVVSADKNSEWGFTGSSTNFSNATIECSIAFGFVVSSDQVAIATRLLEQGMVTPGSYATWEQFMMVHQKSI